MNIRRANKPLFSLPPDHTARRFLEAFISCRQNCVGREIVYSNIGNDPIDQEWISASDGCKHRLSSFAYKYISFDIVLDGWLSGTPELTDSEKHYLERLPRLNMLMTECQQECRNSNNASALALVEQILEVLHLWEVCIRTRLR